MSERGGAQRERGMSEGRGAQRGAAAGTAQPGDAVAALVAARVRDVPDFPQPGVLFKDLTPLFADGPAFRATIEGITRWYDPGSFDVVVGIEARGFLVAAAVAHATGTGVVPVRKAGKLPWRAVSAEYALEYGEAVIEVHQDAFQGGGRALIVDDVLATGGTLAATADLVARAGGRVVGMSVVLELAMLRGRERLSAYDVHSLLTV
jgi:adenine phosphoribosyltransferase